MPSLESVRPIYARTFLDKVMGAFKVVPADPLVGIGSLRLCTAGPSPITPETDEADFTEASFGGYAAGVFTPDVPDVTLPSGLGRGQMVSKLFVCDGTTPETITGYFTEDADGQFLMGEYFPSPIPMTANGDFIDLTVTIALMYEPQVA